MTDNRVYHIYKFNSLPASQKREVDGYKYYWTKSDYSDIVEIKPPQPSKNLNSSSVARFYEEEAKKKRTPKPLPPSDISRRGLAWARADEHKKKAFQPPR